jgi:hypothetical protein
MSPVEVVKVFDIRKVHEVDEKVKGDDRVLY